MVLTSLDKLIYKKETSSIIADLIEAVDSSVSIIDVNGSLLIGDNILSSSNKFPIQLSAEVIGWVFGGDKASWLASLLTYIAGKELKKKTLAREILDRYSSPK